MGWIWLLGFLTLGSVLSYQRASLKVWTVALTVFLVLFTRLSDASLFGLSIIWLAFLSTFLILYIPNWRHKLISQPILNFYRKVMPSMSRTEREALAAGTVGWEGDLFRGNPNWDKLLNIPKPRLSPEEQAFLDGPVEKLCAMADDWDIVHNRADLSPELWSFIKEQGFFSFIIPKEYGYMAEVLLSLRL
jgi:acyl-CoA dehydrogenase